MEAMSVRAASVTTDPSGSWRSTSASRPETTANAPGGSQAMEKGNAVGTIAATALVPSSPTVTTSWVHQLHSQSLPSCQRGDSPIARPVSNTRGAGTTASLAWAELCQPHAIAIRVGEHDFAAGGQLVDRGGGDSPGGDRGQLGVQVGDDQREYAASSPVGVGSQ